MTDDDKFSVVVLQVTNHTLVHRLCLTGRVWRQEKQGHILQAFHFWMSRAVVNDERTLSSLSLTRLVELGNPLYEEFASHTGFLVGVILSWEGLTLLKHLGFADLPMINIGCLSVPDMLAHTIAVIRSLLHQLNVCTTSVTEGEVARVKLV